MEKTLRHWMLMALTALCIGGLFTACEEKEEEQEPNTSDNPTNPENDEIYSKGGTITFEDLTLTFPSGAYSEGWGSEVEVKKRPKGSVISGDEISDCYYVSFFGDTHKPITVKLPSKKDTDIMLAVKSKGFIPSSGKLTMVDMISMFPTTYSNGTYTAQLPAFDFSKGFSEEDFHNLEQSTDVDLTIALVKTDDGNANVRESRAARRVNYVLRWTPSGSKEYDKDLMIRDQIMPDVLDKLQLMGFELPQGDYIPIYMEELKGDHASAWGVYTMNSLNSAFDNVIINKRMFRGTLSEKDILELRCTLLHECQHYIQSHSYLREWTNYGLALDYAFGNAQWQILDECSAVWSEKFYTPTPDLTLSWAYQAVRDFFPDNIWCSYHKNPTKTSLDIEVDAGMAYDRCGNQGYGLSLFVMYLAKIYGDDTPVKLFEARKGGAKTVKECFEKYAQNVKNTDLLKYDTLEDFMYQACTGRIHAKINFNELCSKANNDIIVRKSSGSTTNVKRKMPDVGAEVHSYYIMNSPMDNPVLTITQACPDIKTSIYLVEGEKYAYPKLLGSIINSESFKLTDTDKIIRGKSDPSYTIYTVSIPSNGKPATLDLTFDLTEGITMKLDPDHLDFEAAGSTQTVTVTTNQLDPKITGTIADNSWLSATKNGTTLKFTAKENTSTSERSTIVIVRVRDANDNVVAEQTLKVNQKGKEAVNYQGAFVDTWMSFDKKNILELTSDGRFYKKFEGQAEVNGTYTLIDYTSSDGVWTCTIKDPNDKTVTFGGDSDHWTITYEGVELYCSYFFM